MLGTTDEAKRGSVVNEMRDAVSRSYNYRKTFSYWTGLGPLVLLAGAVVFGIYEVGLEFRNLELLPYPYSAIAFGVGGCALLIYLLYTMRSVRAFNKNPHSIVLFEDSMEFPQGASSKVAVRYRDVSQFWVKTDKDDGESVIIYVDDDAHRYEFFAEGFDSMEEYATFKAFVEERCVNITNR